MGGFHLFQLDDERLDWTADKLKEDGIENLVGAHCTGLEAVYRMRARLGLSRAHAVVGAVGATFQLGKGIDPLVLARRPLFGRKWHDVLTRPRMQRVAGRGPRAPRPPTVLFTVRNRSQIMREHPLHPSPRLARSFRDD